MKCLSPKQFTAWKLATGEGGGWGEDLSKRDRQTRERETCTTLTVVRMMICFTFPAKCSFIFSKNSQYSSLNLSGLCQESHLPLTLIQMTRSGSLQSHIKHDMRWGRVHFQQLRQPPSIKPNRTP